MHAELLFAAEQRRGVAIWGGHGMLLRSPPESHADWLTARSVYLTCNMGGTLNRRAWSDDRPSVLSLCWLPAEVGVLLQAHSAGWHTWVALLPVQQMRMPCKGCSASHEHALLGQMVAR